MLIIAWVTDIPNKDLREWKYTYKDRQWYIDNRIQVPTEEEVARDNGIDPIKIYPVDVK